MPVSAQNAAVMTMGILSTDNVGVLNSMTNCINKVEATGNLNLVEALTAVQNEYHAENITFVEAMNAAEREFMAAAQIRVSNDHTKYLSLDFVLGRIGIDEDFQSGGSHESDEVIEDVASGIVVSSAAGALITLSVMFGVAGFGFGCFAVAVASIPVALIAAGGAWLAKKCYNKYTSMNGGGDEDFPFTQEEIDILYNAGMIFQTALDQQYVAIQTKLEDTQNIDQLKSKFVSLNPRQLLEAKKRGEIRTDRTGDMFLKDGRRVIKGGGAKKPAAKKAVAEKKPVAAKKPVTAAKKSVAAAKKPVAAAKKPVAAAKKPVAAKKAVTAKKPVAAKKTVAVKK